MQRGGRGGALRELLAAPGAPRELDAFVGDRGLELPVVVGSLGGDLDVAGRVGRGGLEHLLELALGVLEVRQLAELAEGAAELARDQVAGGFVAGVQEHRAEHGLERIGQRRAADAPAGGLLAAAEDQEIADLEPASLLRERGAVHELRPCLGERAFAVPRETLVKLVGEDELQHGVAEELQPLVVVLQVPDAGLVRQRRMREREDQQLSVAERVTQRGLEGGCVDHARSKAEGADGAGGAGFKPGPRSPPRWAD